MKIVLKLIRNKRIIQLFALSVVFLFHSCEYPLDMILKNNRAKISDSFQGVWDISEKEDDGPMLFEIKKKDDYWAYIKTSDNKKVNLTVHIYKNINFFCLSAKNGNGEIEGTVMAFDFENENKLKVYDLKFKTEKDETDFKNTPANLKETIFESFLSDGKIYLGNTHTYMKKYKLND